MPTRWCWWERCGNLVKKGGYCPQHEKTRQKLPEKRKPKNKIYDSPKWKKFSKWRLTNQETGERKLCERCEEKIATQVHHKTPIKKGGKLLSTTNTVPVCGPCHRSMENEKDVEIRGID